MPPPVRSYSDPCDGFEEQIDELRGLIDLVPRLVSEDRQRRWDAIGSRPGDPDVEMIDIYENESGARQGWGHADYARTIYSTAVVTAWALFSDYLVQELSKAFVRYDLSDHPALKKIVAEERSSWDYRFERIVKRYDDFFEVKLSRVVENWEEVKHAQELRHALVHNLGLYTERYLKQPSAWRSEAGLRNPFAPDDEQGLLNLEEIPLSAESVDGLLLALRAAARDVRRALAQARS